MSELLGLDHFGIKPEGPTLSLGLAAGQSMTIVGPAGSGKSRFVQILAGRERPGQGAVHVREDIFVPERLPKKTRLQNAVKQFAGIAELLTLTGLWDLRQCPVGELSPAQTAAAEMLPALARSTGVVLLDGHLDHLDPWTLPNVLEKLRRMANAGVALVATTHRPDIVRHFDGVVVLIKHEVRFAGSVDELLRRQTRHELSLETQNQMGVRALLEPFEVSITETDAGLRISAKEGQELAARLLVEGYGDVRMVIDRAPSIEEALRSIR